MQLFPSEIINYTSESHFERTSSKSKVIYITVVLTLFAFFGAMPFIYIDITTQAKGIIRTPGDNNKIQTVVYGEVEEVYIKENTQVNEGDTLLVLDTKKIDEQIHRYREKTIENRIFIKDISNILTKNTGDIKTPKFKAEHSYYKSLTLDRKTEANYLEREFKLHESLYKKGVTPKQEYLQHKNRYVLALNQLRNKQEQFHSQWEAEKTRLELENKEICSSIKQLEEEKTKYVIKAPASGSVIRFTGIHQGSFISPGSTIALITTNDNLIAECYVSPMDIGYIREGQEVIFQLDAFDYNQWGLAHGMVKEISGDIVSANDQAVFCVRCQLKESYLKLKNGHKGNLKKGMTLTGRFFLTRRSLWQLLFDKVDDWMNPKIMDVETTA